MIVTKNLTKRFESLTAVDDVSFKIEPGEVLGFLGPNGAGKSTTMKLITGFLSPSAGSVEVNGYDVESQPIEAKGQIGYLPEGAPLYGEMDPWGFLNFIADLRGLKGTHKRKRLDTVIEELHLEDVLFQPIETLSKGFKRRVGLAQALIHDPKVLILDEPTDGLDPNQKHEVRTLISNMAKDKIIVISTHILEEVDAVCSRAIIINHGRIVADETPQELLQRSRYHDAVTLTLADADKAREGIAALPQVDSVEPWDDKRGLTVFPKSGQSVFPVIQELINKEGWDIEALRVEHGRLDEVFRKITREVRA